MDWASIIGRLFGGFAVKLAVIAVALVLAHSVYAEIAATAAKVSGVLK